MRHTFIVSLALIALTATAVEAAPRRIVCLGDSLTEGYGLSADEAYPAELQRLLKAGGHDVEVINAGVSGATSASGAGRLRWQLRKKPHVVIIALGGNDGLRGQPVASMKKNLETTIELAKNNGIRVLLAGMKIPTNYGEEYRRDFETVFPALAKKYNVALIPFLLDGVAMQRELNLPDGIHPNAAGQKLLAKTVLKHLEPLL